MFNWTRINAFQALNFGVFLPRIDVSGTERMRERDECKMAAKRERKVDVDVSEVLKSIVQLGVSNLIISLFGFRNSAIYNRFFCSIGEQFCSAVRISRIN